MSHLFTPTSNPRLQRVQVKPGKRVIRHVFTTVADFIHSVLRIGLGALSSGYDGLPDNCAEMVNDQVTHSFGNVQALKLMTLPITYQAYKI
ncbi:hypothetical protein GGH93_001120 [Coemansia aciculifera]|nr:hypothetical protein GGH93_001120 [Coemansia aciculifera]